jgi:hypothetical protein
MAEKGKWAEAQVRDVLNDLNTEIAGFAFNRIPDAHGGFMQPADADFQWFLKTRYSCTTNLLGEDDGARTLTVTRNGVIEVKEVEHLHRLPHQNFSKDKINRMWKRKMAGCEDLVLVAHKLKGMRKPDVTWRALPLSFFKETEYVKGVASWDLSHVGLLESMDGFLRAYIKGEISFAA